MILEYITPKPKRKVKQIELTHIQGVSGWREDLDPDLSDATRLVYLGYCAQDGDMFAVYEDRHINIYKGHLNNGKIPKSYTN